MSLRSLIACAALAAACLAPARPGATLRTALAPIGAQGDAPAASAPAAKSTAAALVGRASVTIAIVDTGVAPVGGLWRSLDPQIDLLPGAGGDPNGHGTAMASVAHGVCGACRLLPVRAVGSAGLGTSALAAAGIRTAVERGARVVNLSLVSPSDDSDLDAAIAEATAAGVVVVLAAGNSASGNGTYPAAAAPSGISVGAASSDGLLEPWSNHGAWVDLAAPGELPALDPSGRWLQARGTSASAAYVSGVAGLMLSANPRLTPADVERILAGSGTPSTIDVRSGGVVDEQAALTAALGG